METKTLNNTTETRTNNTQETDFFSNVQLFERLANERKQLETQMEELRKKILPAFNERFAVLGITIPISAIPSQPSQLQTIQADTPSSQRSTPKTNNRRNGKPSKLSMAQDVIVNKLGKHFTVKEFREILQGMTKDKIETGYLIQEMSKRGLIKNVGYAEYEKV